eukprot:TRINITY_DN3066_c0_g1_i1.p1 TRINITY_DN3066_c0_g1~~TRINITY_DN3066_c0_g1_i1.p1  ORF type:complete len:870 (-),score=113.72 TRINITY_DN3066_c0_g1_i1:1237-3846(-)
MQNSRLHLQALVLRRLNSRHRDPEDSSDREESPRVRRHKIMRPEDVSPRSSRYYTARIRSALPVEEEPVFIRPTAPSEIHKLVPTQPFTGDLLPPKPLIPVMIGPQPLRHSKHLGALRTLRRESLKQRDLETKVTAFAVQQQHAEQPKSKLIAETQAAQEFASFAAKNTEYLAPLPTRSHPNSYDKTQHLPILRAKDPASHSEPHFRSKPTGQMHGGVPTPELRVGANVRRCTSRLPRLSLSSHAERRASQVNASMSHLPLSLEPFAAPHTDRPVRQPLPQQLVPLNSARQHRKPQRLHPLSPQKTGVPSDAASVQDKSVRAGCQPIDVVNRVAVRALPILPHVPMLIPTTATAALSKVGKQSEREMDELTSLAAEWHAELVEKQRVAYDAMAKIQLAREATEKQRSEAEVLRLKLRQQEQEVSTLRDECESQLAQVAPVLDAAKRNVEGIDQKVLSELKTLTTPPVVIRDILEAVSRLLGNDDTSWEGMRKFLASSMKERVLHFDVRAIPVSSVAKVSRVLEAKSESFEHERAAKASAAAAPLAAWVRATMQYLDVFKLVHPLITQVDALNASLAKLRFEMASSEQRLLKLDTEVADLGDEYTQANVAAETLRVRVQNHRELLEKQRLMEETRCRTREAMAMAEARRNQVAELSARLQREAEEVTQLRMDAEQQLAQVQPILDSAKHAVSLIDERHLIELKSMSTPPSVIKDILEAVLRMLGNADTSWEAMRKAITAKNFKQRILSYDLDSLTEKIARRVQEVIKRSASSFTAERAAHASRAAPPLVLWVTAILNCFEPHRRVKPLSSRIAKLMSAQVAQSVQLTSAQEELVQLDKQVAPLRDECDRLEREAESLGASLLDAHRRTSK